MSKKLSPQHFSSYVRDKIFVEIVEHPVGGGGTRWGVVLPPLIITRSRWSRSARFCVCCGGCEALAAAAAANNHFFTFRTAPQLSSAQMGDNPLPNPQGSLRTSRRLVGMRVFTFARTLGAYMPRPEVRRCQKRLFFFLLARFPFSRRDFTSTTFMALGNSLMWLYGVKKDALTRIFRLDASQIPQILFFWSCKFAFLE